MHQFVEERGLGVVEVAPLPVRLWPGKIREPDIFFIATEHADRLGEKVCGVPDLVVEVISPGTREADRGEKFSEYVKAGVREYWIVDPGKGTVEVFTLRGHVYEALGVFREGEIVRSEILSGFEVPVKEIFAGTEADES
ncbi:Uma2 family endonuclease [Candidatus Bipolaricaulota sp. J31]